MSKKKPLTHLRLPELRVHGKFRWKEKNHRNILVSQEHDDVSNKLEYINLRFSGCIVDHALLPVDEARALGCWLVSATQPRYKQKKELPK
jgi:hypothetical protein